MAFQTDDVHRYTIRWVRSSFKLTKRIPMKELFWHATGGFSREQPYWEDFLNVCDKERQKDEGGEDQ